VEYFQSVVAEYMQRDCATFINTEFFLVHKNKPNEKGPPEWLVDILAINMREQCAYLCEISYAAKLSSLLKRLQEWHKSWDLVKKTVHARAHLPANWKIRVLLFVPPKEIEKLKLRLPSFEPPAEIVSLEKTIPWDYNRWPRDLIKPQTDGLAGRLAPAPES
jgi:hypothetical protein